MIDPTTHPDPVAPSDAPPPAEPLPIELAPRVRNLPPYLFGRINDLKYRMRRAGKDVIDLGMGNPTDPPEQWIVDKLCEAARDTRNHRYSVASGVYNLRREVTKRYESRWGVTLDPDHEVVATIGSKEGFSHMCLALLGTGDTALAPAPTFPIHAHAVALADANVIALDVRDPQQFLADVARTCQSLSPKPKVLILNYPHNPTGVVAERAFFEEVVALAKKHRFFVMHDFAYGDISFDGYRGAELPVGPGGEGRRVRVHDDVQGLQHGGWRVGFAREPLDAPGAEGDQGVLRLRHLPGRADRGDRRPPARRGGAPGAGGHVPGPPRRAGRGAQPPRLVGREPEGRHVRLGDDARALAIEDGSIDFAMKLLDEAEVAVSPGGASARWARRHLRLALVERRAAPAPGRCASRPC
jgi:alanine-synthesizing transaminase